MALNPHQELVAEHVAAHIGPVTGVFELSPAQDGSLPLALLHVPATEYKPFQVLVSAGMSAEPMAVPDDLDPAPPARVELLIALPGDWSLERPTPEQVWPIRLLADLARFPSEFGGWIAAGHTIPNGDPMVPYGPATQMCCALVAPPLTVPPEAQSVRGPEGELAQLLGLVPLFKGEVDLKLNEGSERLFERLDDHRVNELLDRSRRSVAGSLLDLLDRKSGRKPKR